MFFFFFHCVESKAVAVNLLCTFDVKISRRFSGGLCDGVSSVKVTNSCNQSLFTEILLCLFHNNPPTLPSLIPDCRCDVKGTLSGVRECQQVRTRKPGRDKHLVIKLSFRLQSRLAGFWLKPLFVCVRKVGTVTASQTCTDIHATPARTDTSCCRKRITLAAKVGH